jgi:macrolide transport system ATP-binding/permease protein
MQVIQDVRHAARVLRKAPVSTAVAIVSLAIGVAIVTTVFGWTRTVVLNPLPGVRAPTELVTAETVAPSGTLIDTSYPDFQTWRDSTTLLSGVIAFKERLVGIGSGSVADPAWALMVSGNYFDVLGLEPALGRFFEGRERDDAPDAHPVAVLGHAAWKVRFGGDPAIVGRSVPINRRLFTVIGVAPEDFPGTINGFRFDLFVPLTMNGALTGSRSLLVNRANRPLYVFARLRPGVTIEQGRAEIARIADVTGAEFPDTNRAVTATLLPMADARRGAQRDLGPVLRILLSVGVVVLLIVCANVANLLLAQGASRRREMSIRLGLGATRGRIFGQLLIEGALLGVVAAALGVLFSAWLVDGLRWFVPDSDYPIALTTEIAGADMAFAVGVSLLASVLFALAPATGAARARLAEVMQAGRQPGDPRAGRISSVLVTAQVALALAALVVASLLVRSFDNARHADRGFDEKRVLLAGINLSTAGYDRDSALGYVARLRQAARALPSAEQVAVSEDVPLGFYGGAWEDVRIDGYVPGPGENMKIYRNLVSPGYFELMRIQLLAGRDFTDLDTAGTPLVAIVNETLARRYFGGTETVGRRFTAWGRPLTIIGVAADSKYHQLDEAAEPYFYVPLAQFMNAATGVALHVRTAGDPMTVAPVVQELIRRIDPAVPRTAITSLQAYTSAAYFTRQMAATLLSVLAVLALILSAIGLYGVVSYAVARRHRELGVRVALGATASQILRLVLGQGFTLAAMGAAAGFLLTGLSARALSSMLFGVSPMDVRAIGAATGLLAIVVAMACYLPARRASRLDPLVALREE